MPIYPKIFIAYSRKDEPLLDQLRTHLTPIERSGKVEIWYDGKIEPGLVWEKTIKSHLHDADIILMLVSADAIASDYFYDKEMKDALERHEKGTARVVPLILRPCAWDATPLAKLQALPKDALAVTSWADRDAALSDAVSSLWEMIQNYISDKKQQIAAEKREQERKEAAAKKEQERKEAAAKGELELHLKKEAAAKHKKEQEREMAKLEAEAQIRRKKREAEEKMNAEKRAESRKAFMTKVTSFFRKPIVWGLLGLVVVVFGLSQMMGGKDQTKSEAGKEVIDATGTAEKYELILMSFDPDKKISTIKLVRAVSSMGLKDAKYFVESVPKKIEKQFKRIEAEANQYKFEEIGAKVVMNPVGKEFKFEVYLESIGGSKLSVVKEIKSQLGLGLKESKEIADRAPGSVKKGLSLEEAKKMKLALERTGAKVSIR